MSERVRGSGRIGLSEYTAQRLAELRARRAEAELSDSTCVTGRVSDTAGRLPDDISPTGHGFEGGRGYDDGRGYDGGRGYDNVPDHDKPTLNGSSSTLNSNDSLASGSLSYANSPARVPVDSPTPGLSITSSHAPGVSITRSSSPGMSIIPSVSVTSQALSASNQDVSYKTAPPPPFNSPSVNSLHSYQSKEPATVYNAAIPDKSDRSLRLRADDATGYDSTHNHSAQRSPHSQEDDEECIGFACLPEQVHRKAVKRGFDFTLIVVGESGLGKSTLISSMFFNNELYRDRTVPGAAERVSKTVALEKRHHEIEERGVKLRLTIVDTPGFNDTIDATKCWKPIEDYIMQQFEQYFNDETGLDRRNIKDNRVHCCLYFINPTGRGLRQIDVQCMLRLHNKVNIVPVIAKADTLTPTEVNRLKVKVLEDIERHKIRIYELPQCDSDEDEEFLRRDRELKMAIPFAVIGSNTVVEVNGKKVKGRIYPWGIVEVENPLHSDFTKLRQFLIRTHMQDLKDVTRETHYESYRAGCIKDQQNRSTHRDKSKTKRESSNAKVDNICEADQLLRQKEDEIQRMQEMLHRMQAQLGHAPKPSINGHLNDSVKLH